jgi:hypothetical protein
MDGWWVVPHVGAIRLVEQKKKKSKEICRLYRTPLSVSASQMVVCSHKAIPMSRNEPARVDVLSVGEAVNGFVTLQNVPLVPGTADAEFGLGSQLTARSYKGTGEKKSPRSASCEASKKRPHRF